MSERISTMITFVLIGCFVSNAGAAIRTSPAGTFAENKNERYETRVYTRRQCLLGEEKVMPVPKSPPQNSADRELFPALAAIFAPILIGKAISGIAGALRKAGEDKTRKDSGRLPTYMYRLSREKKLSLNPDLKCVIVVRGIFDPGVEPPVPEVNFPETGIFTMEDQAKRIARLRKNGILVSKLATAYEAEMKFADDETGFLYQSKFFEMNEFQDGKPSDTRGIVISIALNGVGPKEGEPTLSLVLINIGATKRVVLGPDKLTYRSSWVGGLGISDDSLKAIETIKVPSKPSDPPFLGIGPVTVEAVISETEDGNKALKFIADVLDASNEKVTNALTAEITKDRGKAAEEASTALEKLRQEEESAFTDYLEALAAKTTGLTPAELRVVEFKRNTTKRLWCVKLNALKTLGEDPGRSETCP